MATKLCVLICFLLAVARCEDQLPPNGPSIVVDQPVDDVSKIVDGKDENPLAEPNALPKQNINESIAAPAPAAEPAPDAGAPAVLVANETQVSQETNVSYPELGYAKQDVKETGFLSELGQKFWGNGTGKSGGVADISLKTFPGTVCKTDSDCAEIEHSACQNNKCLCKGPEYVNSVFSLNKCIKVPKELGDYCEDSYVCNSVVPASECIQDMCKCPPLFVYADGACLVKQSLGSRCSNTAQCIEIPSGQCLQGICACPEPMVPSPTSNRCLQPAERTFQATCLEDIQCMNTFGDNGRCYYRMCICNDGHHFNSSHCVPDRKLGSRCETKEDCAVSVTIEPANYRTCINNNCTCAKGYKALKGEDSCTKGAAYQLHASIVWVLCICIAKFYF